MAAKLRGILRSLLQDKPFITLYEFRIHAQNRLHRRIRNDLLISSILGTEYILDLHNKTIYAAETKYFTA